MHRSDRVRLVAMAGVSAALALLVAGPVAGESTTSGPFAGVKANTGSVRFSRDGATRMLTLSDDFQVPDTPDPHWQVVDGTGAVHQLARLPIKGDKVNRAIELPAYVPDVAKVQIWCAFAETLLGEATFASPVR